MALSDDALKEINDYIYRQGAEWAKNYIQGRAEYLRKKGIAASGDLIRSLEFEVTQTLQEAATVKIDIAFLTSGRYVDLKNQRPAAGGEDYLKSLEKWIEAKGFRQRWTSVFLEKRKLRNAPPNIVNQMAWGIVVKRQQKYKQRKWYARSSVGSVTDLYNIVAADLPRIVSQEIIKTFGNGNQTR